MSYSKPDRLVIDHQKLRAARLATGLSQVAVGLALGLGPFHAQQVVSRLERGKRNRSRHLAKLAQVLGVEVAALLSPIGEVVS